MKNLLSEEVEYKIVETRLGVWRRFMYSTGATFAEFKSHTKVFGLPLVHYTYGKCPDTGHRIVARGVIAVGRLAAGGIAIGHASVGLVAIGQLGIGLLLGLGQACFGIAAVGQLAVGLGFGLGQLTTGYVAIGQFAFGNWVLGQVGVGRYVWSQRAAHPEAVEFFTALFRSFTGS